MATGLENTLFLRRVCVSFSLEGLQAGAVKGGLWLLGPSSEHVDFPFAAFEFDDVSCVLAVQSKCFDSEC